MVAHSKDRAEEGLDLVVQALHLAMEDRLDELDDDALENSQVQDYLTRYFSESEIRPEVISLLLAPSTVKAFLDLNLEEKAELQIFHERRPEYLNGKGSGSGLSNFKSTSMKKILRMGRLTRQILTTFEFYLEHRKEGQIFGPGYITEDPLFLDKFDTLGKNLYSNARRYFDVDELFNLAAQKDSRISNYSTFAGVLKIDGSKQLVRFFDFYLEHRRGKQIFGPGYIIEDPLFLDEFGTLGKNLCKRVRRHLNGGVDELFELAAKEDSRISNYRTFAGVFKVDGPKQLVRLFEFYLVHREEGQVFGPNYIKKNKLLREQLGTIGYNLQQNARKFFDGGVEELFELAAEEDPRILAYRTAASVAKIDVPKQFVRLFEFYLDHRKEGQVFCHDYLTKDPLFLEEFGTLGRNVYQSPVRFFDRGVEELFELTAEEDPRILDYSTFVGVLKIDGPRQLVRLFDFFLENKRRSQKFDRSYIAENKEVRAQFGTIGMKLYHNSLKYFSDGINHLVLLAAQERPEILEYWHYKGRLLDDA